MIYKQFQKVQIKLSPRKRKKKQFDNKVGSVKHEFTGGAIVEFDDGQREIFWHSELHQTSS
jgi:hypothetical protein